MISSAISFRPTDRPRTYGEVRRGVPDKPIAVAAREPHTQGKAKNSTTQFLISSEFEPVPPEQGATTPISVSPLASTDIGRECAPNYAGPHVTPQLSLLEMSLLTVDAICPARSN